MAFYFGVAVLSLLCCDILIPTGKISRNLSLLELLFKWCTVNVDVFFSVLPCLIASFLLY